VLRGRRSATCIQPAGLCSFSPIVSTSERDANFVDVCLKGGAPRSSLDDAIVAQKVIEACEKSVAEGVTVAIA
jgi:predicted dehydrogenase